MAVAQGVKLKDHAVLALDIGTRFIKVAEMRLARGMISLVNVAVSPTPPGVVDSNQILDPVGLGRALKSLMAANKFRTRKVVISISGQSSVVVRPIDLPKMSLKELTDTMRFEVERHIPFTADEVVMDYAPIIDPDDLPEEETNMKVLLAVAQEELIKSYLKVISVAGLQPVALDVEILASMRALIDIHQRTGQLDNTLALVSIGAVSTDISIINQGNLIFTRSVPIAGDSLTDAIADQLGRSNEEAEELKKEYGRVFLEAEEPIFGAAEGDMAEGKEEVPSAGGLFDAFGSAPGAPGGGSLFSLDDDGSAPLNLGTPVPPAQPAPASPAFEVDDGVDDELPVFRFGLGADEEAEGQDVPVFSLDEDNVDDDVPIPGGLQPEIAPAPAAGAVFDLGAELERQLPSYSRPASAETPAGPAAEATPTSLPNLLDTAQPAPAGAGDGMLQMQVPLTEASDGGYEEQGESLYPGDLLGAYSPEDAAQADIFQRRIFDAMMPTLVELVTEIRRSFEYFTSREPDTPIDRVLIYGGTSRLPYLIEFIQQELGLDVQQADPLVALDLSQFRQPADYLKDVAPALPICIGLGLRDMLA
ncbi:MAG: type IV pilus assembly protein PilM [Armatimonadota bacterium]